MEVPGAGYAGGYGWVLIFVDVQVSFCYTCGRKRLAGVSGKYELIERKARDAS